MNKTELYLVPQIENIVIGLKNFQSFKMSINLSQFLKFRKFRNFPEIFE